jgi:hypothetical protein
MSLPSQKAQSFQKYDVLPSAIISDGVVPIPLYGVTMMSISESYHLPPIGSSGQRTAVATHDDTISLTGVLVGHERYAWKFALETVAEASKRGTALEGLTGGAAGGLILITAMTIRTDMQVQALTFTASSAKRAALDLSITLVHMPRPGALTKILELASLAVGGLADFGGN